MYQCCNLSCRHVQKLALKRTQMDINMLQPKEIEILDSTKAVLPSQYLSHVRLLVAGR